LQFVELSNKFYTLVSHVVAAGQTLPAIDNLELLKQKLHMVESLAEIEIAARLLRQKDPEMEKHAQNPLDIKYAKMHVQLTPVQQSSREWELVERALTSTSTSNSGFTVSVSRLFRVAREGEAKRFEPFSREPNRRLLWHGSRMSNLVGLLSQGIRIAPPEAPVSGYMFGKGIYLADMGGKSCEYCHATPSNPVGVVLLSVACCCYADYHLQQITHGTCDIHITIKTTYPGSSMWEIQNSSAHGFFVKATTYHCNDQDNCKLMRTRLFRPDFNCHGLDARVFTWDPSHCDGTTCWNFVNDNPYHLFEGWFKKREPATFHGINCFKYYNTTQDMYYAFGDDTKDVVYGFVIPNDIPPLVRSEFTYEITEESHTPNDFAFDPKTQNGCDPDAYSTPDRDFYSNACRVVPK